MKQQYESVSFIVGCAYFAVATAILVFVTIVDANFTTTEAFLFAIVMLMMISEGNKHISESRWIE